MKSILLLTSSLLVALAFACSAGTGGRAISIEMALSGTDEPSFTTTLGWDVELSMARITVGPVRIFAPADAPIAQLLLPSRAFAHGGLDPLDGRAVRGELLELIELDALDPMSVERAAPGEEGPVDEVSVELVPPRMGATAQVAGEAMRDGETVSFSGEISLEEDEFRRVEGIELAAFLTEGSRVEVTVDPRIEDVSQAHAAWRIGLRSARAFHAQFSQPEGTPES